MRLMRAGERGAEFPVALITRSGQQEAVDISSLIADVTATQCTLPALHVLNERITGAYDRLPRLQLSGLRTAAPIADPGKIVCVGLNYRAHAAEAGLPLPAEPILFLKASDTVVGPDDDVFIPHDSVQTDYEVELAVVIGRTARSVPERENALDYVAGYTISDDVSERSYQFDRGGQWDKGKNCETFNPLGPVFVSSDEVPDPQDLHLTTTVNGEERQSSSTADMIFTVEQLVRYISTFMTLYPGDIINTGTPQGVGSGFSPPRFLREGDVVEIGISTLGRQRHTLTAPRFGGVR